MKRSLFLIVVIVTMFLFSVVSFADTTREYEVEYEVNEKSVLNIKNTNGFVKVMEHKGDNILINAKLHSTEDDVEFDDIKIEIEEVDEELVLETRNPREDDGVEVELNIKIPKTISLGEVKSVNGEIRISGSKGNLNVHTINGAISVNNFGGVVDCKTVNGSIEITESMTIKHVKTVNGSISIELYSIPETGLKVKTVNGAIDISVSGQFGADVDIHTNNGEISISGLELNDKTEDDKTIKGKLLDGGPELKVKSNNGSIQLGTINK